MSVDNMAKIAAAVLVAAGVALRPLPVPAQSEIELEPLTESDTRLYLADGTVVMGRLIEHSKDLLILQVKEQVFTFELEEIDRIVTLDSLGAGARTVSVFEFPYISFLGGTVAFGLLSWLQFDTASDRERDADLNEASGVLARARELRDKADRARLLGWSSAVLAASSTVVALIPRKETRRVFPELTLQPQAPGLTRNSPDLQQTLLIRRRLVPAWGTPPEFRCAAAPWESNPRSSGKVQGHSPEYPGPLR